MVLFLCRHLFRYVACRGLLHFPNLDNKKCHKAATRNCTPQGRLDKGPLCLSDLDARGVPQGYYL